MPKIGKGFRTPKKTAPPPPPAPKSTSRPGQAKPDSSSPRRREDGAPDASKSSKSKTQKVHDVLKKFSPDTLEAMANFAAMTSSATALGPAALALQGMGTNSPGSLAGISPLLGGGIMNNSQMVPGLGSYGTNPLSNQFDDAMANILQKVLFSVLNNVTNNLFGSGSALGGLGGNVNPLQQLLGMGMNSPLSNIGLGTNPMSGNNLLDQHSSALRQVNNDWNGKAPLREPTGQHLSPKPMSSFVNGKGPAAAPVVQNRDFELSKTKPLDENYGKADRPGIENGKAPLFRPAIARPMSSSADKVAKLIDVLQKLLQQGSAQNPAQMLGAVANPAMSGAFGGQGPVTVETKVTNSPDGATTTTTTVTYGANKHPAGLSGGPSNQPLAADGTPILRKAS